MPVTTRLVRKAAFLACIVFAASCMITGASAQEFPSHVQPLSVDQDAGFYSSERLSLFAALATDEAGILQGIIGRDFTNASARFAHYTGVVNEFSLPLQNLTANGDDKLLRNTSVLKAIVSSQNTYSELLGKSKRYQELYSVQSRAPANSTASAKSVQNALEMKTLNTDIKTLWNQTNAPSEKIYGRAAAAGLNMSDYDTTRQAFNGHFTFLDSQLTNVTNAAFRNTTTTMRLNTGAATYGDHVDIRGAVKDGKTGVANGTVLVKLGNTQIALLQTDANGSYAYDYFVDGAIARNYSVLAEYTPANQSYKASKSTSEPLSITNSSTTNTIIRSGSLLGGAITFDGIVETDNGPVRDGFVRLWVNGNEDTYAWTDANGRYHIDYSVSRLAYLSSILSSSNQIFYTKFAPGRSPLEQSTSDVIIEPVVGTYVAAASPFSYIAIAATVTVLPAALIRVAGRRLRLRRRRADASKTVPPDIEAGTMELEGAAPIELESTVTVTKEVYPGIEEVVRHVNTLCKARDFNGAIAAAYSGVLALVVETRGIAVKPSTSHWETFALIAEHVPGVHDDFRELTYLHELARYSGRTMRDAHVKTVIKHVRAIDALMQRSGGDR